MAEGLQPGDLVHWRGPGPGVVVAVRTEKGTEQAYIGPTDPLLREMYKQFGGEWVPTRLLRRYVKTS